MKTKLVMLIPLMLACQGGGKSDSPGSKEDGGCQPGTTLGKLTGLVAEAKNDPNAVELRWTSTSTGEYESWVEVTWKFVGDSAGKSYSRRERLNNGGVILSNFYHTVYGTGAVMSKVSELSYHVQDCEKDNPDVCGDYSNDSPVAIPPFAIKAPTSVVITEVPSQIGPGVKAVEARFTDNSIGEFSIVAGVCNIPPTVGGMVTCTDSDPSHGILSVGSTSANGTLIHLDELPPNTKLWLVIVPFAKASNGIVASSIPVVFTTSP